MAKVARLRKMKKPITSVAVVTIIEEARAGSIFSERRPKGTSTPARAAAIMFRSMARNTTSPRMGIPIQSHDARPAKVPIAKPVVKLVMTSFKRRGFHSSSSISPRARERTTMVRVWLPALPPSNPTIGRKKARIAYC